MKNKDKKYASGGLVTGNHTHDLNTNNCCLNFSKEIIEKNLEDFKRLVSLNHLVSGKIM